VLDAVARIETLIGRPMRHEYVDQNRKGDHLCYISNLATLKTHFPGWSITRGLNDIPAEVVAAPMAG
jgi:CDP-paratose 2-epimerase